MYRAFGLLQSTTEFTLDAAAARLTAKFPGAAVTRAGDQVTVATGDWSIALALNAAPHVLAESAELAEQIAGREDGADLAACARRVEVGSETPDPTMEHFNDFLSVVEVLQSFRGVIVIDPNEPALM